jgi:hypothetical protein
MVVGAVATLSFVVAASSSVLAQSVQPAQQSAATKTPDPNEVVCEKEQDSSSRIATKRVCMTRSQWAEQRRLNRQDIEKVQVQRPCTDRC